MTICGVQEPSWAWFLLPAGFLLGLGTPVLLTKLWGGRGFLASLGILLVIALVFRGLLQSHGC